MLRKKRTQLEYYRSGVRTLPSPVFERLLSLLPDPEQSRHRSQVISKERYWKKIIEETEQAEGEEDQVEEQPEQK